MPQARRWQADAPPARAAEWLRCALHGARYRDASFNFHPSASNSRRARGDIFPVSQMLRSDPFRSSRFAKRTTRSVHDT